MKKYNNMLNLLNPLNLFTKQTDLQEGSCKSLKKYLKNPKKYDILDLSHQTINVKKAKELAKVLKKHGDNLVEINLYCCKLNDETGLIIGKALEYCTNLIELNIFCNDLSDSSASEILTTILKHNKIMSISISNNDKITETTYEVLLKELNKNTSLIEFDGNHKDKCDVLENIKATLAPRFNVFDKNSDLLIDILDNKIKHTPTRKELKYFENNIHSLSTKLAEYDVTRVTPKKDINDFIEKQTLDLAKKSKINLGKISKTHIFDLDDSDQDIDCLGKKDENPEE
jgi:hypothetical protein